MKPENLPSPQHWALLWGRRVTVGVRMFRLFLSNLKCHISVVPQPGFCDRTIV